MSETHSCADHALSAVESGPSRIMQARFALAPVIALALTLGLALFDEFVGGIPLLMAASPWYFLGLVLAAACAICWVFSRPMSPAQWKTAPENEFLSSIVRGFRIRARHLRVTAWMVIGVILVVLLVGVGVFQRAESSAFAAVNPLQQEINDIDRDIIRMQMEVNDAERNDAPEDILQKIREVLNGQLERKNDLLGLLQNSPNLRPRANDTAVLTSALTRIMREGAVEGETQEPPCGTNVMYTTF